MLLRLLRIAARYPLSSLALTLAAPAAAAAALLALRPAAAPPAAAAPVAPAAPVTPGSPELLLNRIWFDSYPESPRDRFSLWLFTDEDFGVYRQGSAFRFLVDLVEFERKNDQLTVNVLEDNKKKETRFAIRACDDKPPFDLCLTFSSPVLGQGKYYGFKDSEQQARRMPWLPRASLVPPAAPRSVGR